MNIYNAETENIIEDLTAAIEQETGNKIFTMRILQQTEEGLETIVAFEDKTILMALISVQTIDGKLACRIRGKYL